MRTRTLGTYILVATPFTSGLYLNVSGSNIYAFNILFVIYLAISLTQTGKIILDRRVTRFILATLLISAFFYLIHETAKPSFLLNFLSLTIAIICYVDCIKKNGITDVFKSYINMASVMSGLAVLQLITHMSGLGKSLILSSTITKQYGSIISASGLSAEPSNFAIALTPAAVIAITSILSPSNTAKSQLTTNLQSALIIAALAVSTSSLGYLGVAISTLIVAMKSTRSKIAGVFFGATLATVSLAALLSLEFFSSRVYDSIALLSSDTTSQQGNLSSYSQYVNLNISITSIQDNLFTGVGFDAYETEYDKYISNFDALKYMDLIPGRGTATSLLLKVSVEFGAIGLAFLVYFLARNYNPAREGSGLINTAILVAIILISIRMGTYISNGVALFFLMYMFTSRNTNHSRLSQNTPVITNH